MRARGITMPLLLGIPGPVDRTKLLAMATKIGVGESTRFLAKHKGTFARLAAPGGFTGERFLEKFAPALSPPDALAEGLHVFTFNQVAATEAWRRTLLDQLTTRSVVEEVCATGTAPPPVELVETSATKAGSPPCGASRQAR